MKLDDFHNRSWCHFSYNPQLADWVNAARPHAKACLNAPELAQWWRQQRTWFAGVNGLPNDTHGTVGESGPLRGAAIDFLEHELHLHPDKWDQAQVSVCFPGYPQKSDNESTSAFRFRLERDAAHVDGLLPEGPQRRRFLREHHAFILGIPMVEFDADAAPFVIWEGSHRIIYEALSQRLSHLPVEKWAEEDVTETYHHARHQVFEKCRRVKIHARPGEAYLAHRLSVHGVAPWSANAKSKKDKKYGRMICYFRPELSSAADWLAIR